MVECPDSAGRRLVSSAGIGPAENAQSHSLVVKGEGGTSGATACAPATAGGASPAAVRGFFGATGFLAMALPFFFAAFLPADFNFRFRIAFFVVALCFLGMGVPRDRSYMASLL
jgi:hypothetical protein